MSIIQDMQSVGDTFDLILETIESIFEQANVPLPERRYLYVGDQGQTAHDCEQLTISLAQLQNGPPGAQDGLPTRCDQPKTGIFYVELVRCVADKPKTGGRGRVNTPTPADLSMHAKAQAIDMYLLMEAGLLAGQQFLNAITSVIAGPVGGDYQAMVLELMIGIG
jgi:hypothetical protein